MALSGRWPSPWARFCTGPELKSSTCPPAARDQRLNGAGHCYDTSTLKFIGVTGPGGDSIALDSVTHDRYAVKADAKALYVVDATTKKQTAIPSGQTPTSVAVDSATHLAYVADHDAKTILVIDPSD